MPESYLSVFRKFPNYPETAIHSYMEDLARKSHRAALVAVIEYPDGSRDDHFEVFQPETRVVPYKVRSGETYAVEFHTRTGYNSGWFFDFKTLTKKQLLQSLTEWFARDPSEVPPKITLVPEE